MWAGLAVVLALAVVGFFVGIRQDTTAAIPTKFAVEGGVVTAPLARSNEELSVRPWSTEHRRWTPRPASPAMPVMTADDAAKAGALLRRVSRRAYEGAPPTIPHPIGQASGVECRACHERGAAIGAAIAPPFGHDSYTMCTQCHVPEVAPLPPTDPARGASAAANTFVGWRGAEAPYRLGPDSPPQIPHRTLMRERCLACHGPNGRQGLQSSHPERKDCRQCHAPSAAADQRAL